LYDEHGGFYDHVIPPSDNVPNPDGINSPPPGNMASWPPEFAFDRLGFRVPAIIASPWVAQGRVDSTLYQHTSVLATLKALFGLSSFLTKRDASAKSFEALFSELSAPRTDTPESLPLATMAPVSVSPEDPAHPANQPMDATQTELLLGVHEMMRRAYPEMLDGANLHMTQGEASSYIRSCYEHHWKTIKGTGTFHGYRVGDKHFWRLCDAKGRMLAKSAVSYPRRAAAIAAVKQAQAAAAVGRVE
jgi:phospholipase C